MVAFPLTPPPPFKRLNAIDPGVAVAIRPLALLLYVHTCSKVASPQS
jgi:hypothetical protein